MHSGAKSAIIKYLILLLLFGFYYVQRGHAGLYRLSRLYRLLQAREIFNYAWQK